MGADCCFACPPAAAPPRGCSPRWEPMSRRPASLSRGARLRSLVAVATFVAAAAGRGRRTGAAAPRAPPSASPPEAPRGASRSRRPRGSAGGSTTRTLRAARPCGPARVASGAGRFVDSRAASPNAWLSDRPSSRTFRRAAGTGIEAAGSWLRISGTESPGRMPGPHAPRGRCAVRNHEVAGQARPARIHHLQGHRRRLGGGGAGDTPRGGQVVPPDIDPGRARPVAVHPRAAPRHRMAADAVIDRHRAVAVPQGAPARRSRPPTAQGTQAGPHWRPGIQYQPMAGECPQRP